MEDEVELMKQYETADGPSDEHEVEVIEYADSERRARDRSW
ncbi:hypothetical protein [uncultured Bifidobacterium sp.]|nr:hypothetical protein [uncultured Bifidobacterium sp.]